MNSAEWKKRSLDKKYLCNFQCFICKNDYKKNGSYLTTHHLTYERLGNEKESDLVCLCFAHHSKGKLTLKEIHRWRNSYRSRKLVEAVLSWTLRTLVRTLRGLIRISARTAKLMFQGFSWLLSYFAKHLVHRHSTSKSDKWKFSEYFPVSDLKKCCVTNTSNSRECSCDDKRANSKAIFQ